MTEIEDRYETLKLWANDHSEELNPFAEYWSAMMCILSDEELLRFLKRCSLPPMDESVLGYRLGEALSSELTRRDMLLKHRQR